MGKEENVISARFAGKAKREATEVNAALRSLLQGGAESEPLVNRALAIAPESFDLSGISTTLSRRVAMSGHALLYKRRGSNPWGHIWIEVNGRQVEMYPGCRIVGQFNEFQVLRHASSDTSGTVNLLVVQDPALAFEEPEQNVPTEVRTYTLGPAGATTQAYNSAAGNVPTALTDGFPLLGVKGFRVLLLAASSTLSAGSLRFWYQPNGATAADWRPNGGHFYSDVGGNSQIGQVWDDEEVLVLGGRGYVEARSVTAAAGSPLLTVQVECYG